MTEETAQRIATALEDLVELLENAIRPYGNGEKSEETGQTKRFVDIFVDGRVDVAKEDSW